MQSDELEDEFIDLKVNKYIIGFRTQHIKEYEIIKQFNNMFKVFQKKLGKKGKTQQNVFIMASMMQLHKLYQSSILLFERGLKESANVLIRTILDLIFKIIEVIRNEDFVEDLLIEQEYELKNTLNDVKKNKIFDMIPEDKVDEIIEECSKKINGSNRPNTKSQYIAKKNGLNKEYILYRLQCEYTHQSTSIIGSIIKFTKDSCFIDGNFQLKDFKQSIAWLISITAIVFPVLLNEYLKDEELKREYIIFLKNFEDNFKDLI